MFRHPIWLVGFRPFFTLAIFAAVLLPLWWALVFAGVLRLPEGLSPIQWHAHEMLFGFGWAVLGGFLLTASKNWVKIRGLHGGPLALAALLWLLERVAVLLPSGGALGVVRGVLLYAFATYVIGYLVWTLVRHRKQDTFPDNVFFIVGLPVFLVARALLLDPTTWVLGQTLSIGIFRLAFAVMFERTITQFMKGAEGVTLPRRRWVDYPIKGLVLLSAFEALLPPPVAALVLAAAGTLLFARLCTWSPQVGFRTFGIGIMYAGYLGLCLHFWLAAARYAGTFVGVGTPATHAFTFLCMGLIIPAMFIRIGHGHTGRKIVFTALDRIAIGAMAAGAFFRLVATQLWVERYATWVALSAIGWALCFALIGIRIIPFLLRPRVDGKEH